MAQTRIGQVDLTTGELLEGATLAVIYPKRKNGFQEGWVAMAQNAMLKLAQLDLGNEANRVLWVLLAKLDFENWINLPQIEVAELLGLQRQNVSRAMAKLVDAGIVLEGPKVGRNRTYRLNPAFGWKGSARGHNDALTERLKARGMRVIEGGSNVQQIDRDPNTGDLFEGDEA